MLDMVAEWKAQRARARPLAAHWSFWTLGMSPSRGGEVASRPSCSDLQGGDPKGLSKMSLGCGRGSMSFLRLAF